MEAAHHPWPALGALLLRDGLVDADQLEDVLTEQEDDEHHRISARRLGELLVERGTVTYAQVAQLLAEQYELPFVELAESDINLRAATLLSEDQARRFSALPISVLPDASVLVATSDPPLVLFSDEFRRLLGVSLRYAVAPQDEVDRAIAYASANASRFETAAPASVAGPELHPELTSISPAEDERLFIVPEHPRAHRSAALGALLVRDGLATQEEVDAALAQQRITGSRRLGEILVERGTVTRTQVARLVAEQYDLPFVEIDPSRVQRDASNLLPESVARRLSALPLGASDDGTLLVVVSDPTNVVYADELRLALESPVRFAVAAPDEIDAAIDVVQERHWAEAREDEHQPDYEPEPKHEYEFRQEHESAPEREDEYTHEHEDTTSGGGVVVDLWNEESRADEPAALEVVQEAEDEGPPLPLFGEVPEWDTAYDLLAEIEEVPMARALHVAEPPDEPPIADEPSVATLAEPEETRVEPATVEETPASEPQLDEDLLAEVEETVAVVVELDTAGTTEDASEHGALELDIPAEIEGDVPVADEVLEAIRVALSLGATTVQFAPQPRGLLVRARIDRAMRELDVFPRSEQEVVTHRLTELAGIRAFEALPRHGVLSFTDGDRTSDLVASTLPTKLGTQVNLRVPSAEGAPSTISELGLSSVADAALREALRQRCGTVLVCGPVVSGKTTTLYALARELAAPERMLVSIEDPVERLTPGVDQVEVNIPVGLTLAGGLRAILRSAPDVVLVGDVRDGETANVALRASRADHLVLAALEAPTVASSVSRLGELGVEPLLLSATLSCVVAQHLVRRVCADCRETYYASADEIAVLGRPDEESGRRLLARGRGCAACSGTGYRGFAAVFEVLPLTERLRALVGEGASPADLRDAAVEDGMSTVRDEAVGLCLDGVTTVAEVRVVASD